MINVLKKSVIFTFLIINLTACAVVNKNSDNSLLKLIENANESYELGLLTDAEAQYRSITVYYPEYYEAWLKLGNIYARSNQLEAAIVAYDNCLQKKPDESRCWNNKALARLKQAVSTIREARVQFPKGSQERVSLDLLFKRIVNSMSSNNNLSN